MSVNEARDLLLNKVLVFVDGPAMEQGEHDFFAGQKARVYNVFDVSVDDTAYGTVIQLQLDFSDFEEHNKGLAKPVYFDKQHNPTRRWHETAHYPKDCLTNLFLSGEPEDWPFVVDDDGKALVPVVLSPEKWQRLVEHVGLDRLKAIGVA